MYTAAADDAEHDVRATLRSDIGNRPAVIDFWADARSGVVLRAETIGPHSRQERFELIESPTLSDQWYHYGEHAGNVPVERLGEQ